MIPPDSPSRRALALSERGDQLDVGSARAGGVGQRVDRLGEEAVREGERAVRHASIVLEQAVDYQCISAAQRMVRERRMVAVEAALMWHSPARAPGVKITGSERAGVLGRG